MKLEVDEGKLDRLSGEKQDLAATLLRDLTARIEANPLEAYFPHPKQATFHSFTAPVVCFFGGTQSGKTTGGLADDIIQAIDREACPEHLKKYKRFDPPFLCRIMAPSVPVLEIVIFEKLKELLPKDQLAGKSWSNAYDKNLRVLHFANGSKFHFATYEQDVGKMGGATLDRVHYDEEPPKPHRIEGRFRVMRKAGQEVFSMTPVEGLTYTYNDIWKHRGEEIAPDVWEGEIPGEEEDEPTPLQVVTVDIDDNPAIGPKEKATALAGLSKEERQARKSGRFVALHGLIYSDFRRDKHVIPSMDELPQHINVVVGIDPGIRNKAAVVWLYLTADDSMVAFEEGYYEGYTVAQVCTEIHKTNERYKVKPMYYVIDPSARNMEHQTGRSDQMEYADHGVVAIAGQHAVPAGINRVKERLQYERLFFTANCQNLIEEIIQYRWKDPPRSGEDGRQAPVKRDDHLLDALRYAVMSRPYLPELPSDENETELQRVMREDQEGGPEVAMTEYGGII